jgi:CRISPR-associated endonuclease/helicase Cas3
VYDLIAGEKSVVLQAPTGAGKTFAALAPFVLGQWGADNGPAARKLIYSLPLRVLAGSLKAQYEDDMPARVAGSPLRFTTQYSGATEDRFLDGGDEYWMPGENNVVSGTRHAVFTTIDQTLSGFADVPLSVSYRQANVLCGSILSGALIFDEFHLLEPDKSFQTALHLLDKSPWPVLIMTATMSRTLRRELCDILDAEEVVVGEKDIPHIKSQHETVKHICVADRPLNGGKIADKLGEHTLIICNRVARAQKVFDTLDEALEKRGDDRKRMLLHSRFLPEDRAGKEENIEAWFGEDSEEQAVLVATQVVEAGLDISADVMHTEISPIDSFLQRIGRSARFAGEDEAQIHVYPLPSMEKASNFLPYDEESTRRTIDHLGDQKNLRFTDLQGLIDQILTEYHEQIIQAYHSGRATRASLIQQTRETNDYAANKILVRHIDNVDVILSDPVAMERGEASPYAYPAVSVTRGTLRGFLSKESSRAFVVKEFTDEAGQQPDDKYFMVQPVVEGMQLPSRRFVIEPTHAAYDKRLGLRLGESGDRTFEPSEEAAGWMRYEYEEEEYKEHIRRLYEQREVRKAPLDALRRLSASNRHPHINVCDPERVIDLIIWAHDLAKLADGWQWACGDPDPPLAHGGRIEGRRPSSHAAESARAAAVPIAKMLQASGESRDTCAQAMAAIRTHHSPGTTSIREYKVNQSRREYLHRITPELHETLAGELAEVWDDVKWKGPAEESPVWPDRDASSESTLIRSLLVYMLRRSDQLATSEVSKEHKIDGGTTMTGVSNIL